MRYLPFSTFLVPLGSVPELPAESCAEIRASEGENAVSGNYWFSNSTQPGEVVLDRCDMFNQGKYTSRVLWFGASASSNKPPFPPPSPFQIVSIISGKQQAAIGFPATCRQREKYLKDPWRIPHNLVNRTGISKYLI